MAADVREIIATINPDLYFNCEGDKRKIKEFKKFIENEGFQKAVEVAKPQALRFSGETGFPKLDPFAGTEAKHTIVYDSSSETLEPIYFFLLDLMQEFGLKVEKLVDNFTSSPGSGHFGELGQRLTVMQQQGSKLMGDINTVVRSILNLIYDLKEFKIRLGYYDDLNDKDERIKQAARLSLKQIWMDRVDSQKGNSALKIMASTQVGFVTLIDAFLAADSLEEANKLDLNDRVKRIIIGRVAEFELWLKESGRELRKRYELEKTYLRSQVSSLKLYVRWAKPYLRTAQQLEMTQIGGARNPEYIKTFNTILLQLTLLGKVELKSDDLPPEIKKIKPKRKYYSCYVVDFKFRGIPQRVSGQGHYAFGGRAEVTLSAYSLNEDELKAIDEKLNESDIEDGLKLIEGMTTESLEQLQGDIDYFLNEDSEKEKENKKNSEDVNPFLALIGYYESPSKKESKSEEKKSVFPIRKDDWFELKILRETAGVIAKDNAFTLFDVYKKAHGMVSFT